jgi:hypothetical protein
VIPRTIIASVVSETLSRLSVGFRRSGTNLYAINADTIHVINFQSSRDSCADEVIMTVNIGVYSIPLAVKLEKLTNKPSVWDCHWRARIGDFTTENDDKWWHITDGRQVRGIAEEIAAIIDIRVIPTLNGLLTTSDLAAYWRSGGYGGLTEGTRQDYLDLLAR